MVLVDAVVEIVFMVQASVGGKWELGNLKNFQITTSPTACMDSLCLALIWAGNFGDMNHGNENER
jgi:hypothetical protein